MDTHVVLLFGFVVIHFFVSSLSSGVQKRFLFKAAREECILCECYNECNYQYYTELRNCHTAYPRITCSDIDRCTCCDSHPKHKPCFNNGKCTNTGNSGFTCACPNGYSGNRCENNATAFSASNHCLSNPCANGATCNNGPTNYTCQCQTGWTGHNCDTVQSVDLCANSPCKNGGVCTNAQNSYMCQCAVGWKGANCETDINECTYGQPCKNGATCTNTPGHYTCSCLLGWTGDNCDLDACHIKQCGSHGVCIHQDTFPFYHCNCTDGHFGTHCELRACDVRPCHNGGSCTAIETSPYFRCECPKGHMGDTCSLTPSWSDWYYGPCSVTCGNGIHTGIRKCNTGHDEDCAGVSMETTVCSQTPCARSLE